MWGVDPVLAPFKQIPVTGRLAGYAGSPNQQAAEVQTKYIVVDMYAKAIEGMSPADAVKWAHGEMVKVYSDCASLLSAAPASCNLAGGLNLQSIAIDRRAMNCARLDWHELPVRGAEAIPSVS